MRVVFIENHDSFSWNVLDLLPFASGTVQVVDGHTPRTLLALDHADFLIIGPGPMDPERTGLVQVVRRAVELKLPTLGICLGHQAIGVAFGAVLVRATPTHGQRAKARFHDSARFLNGEFEVMRYHSLSLTDVVLPLKAVAHLDDGTVMAIEHQTLPIAGLQFHPDSHGTPRGRALVEAFIASVP